MKTKRHYRWSGFTRQEKIIFPISHLIFFILSIWVLLPIIFVLLNSFKSVQEYNSSVMAFPKIFMFSNYKDALFLTYRNSTIIKMFFNTIIFVTTFSLANILSASMTAYVLSKYKFFGRNFIYTMAIVVQIIPIFGTGGAAYLLVDKLGILDNIWLLWITAFAGFDYTFLIIYSYFRNVSWEYAEAAFIDGAGSWYVFLKIMLPMVSPALLTMWISACIALWGDYMTPMLYLQNNPTLASGIYNLKTLAAFTKGGATVYFAAIIISVIPLVIIFLTTQRKMFSINMEGGIKG